ncbi:ABC transporter substrate-binding protein [uncultured Clostridium sp.]|uniref:ABC transporter substrate-binding protein n=1 Tax=uncultured Clostridium sp. TaxID=59620 RepID=UPI0025F64F17|nr:ABC transporter substrate-binding protein [uncultured Clostridium sp.]
MKKISYICLVGILSLLLTSCGTHSDDNIVNISILNSKPEISANLDNAIKEFTKENNNINIKIVKYSQTGSYTEKLNSLKASNNMPTLSLVDSAHLRDFKDIGADLSSEQWINDISGGVTDSSKNDNGEIIAFPFSTEGIGFIYNKKVIDEAGIDINSINTISALEDAFKKINSIGKNALIITNEEWSLGDHFLSTFYSVDSKDFDSINSYFENLKAQAGSLNQNANLNGLIDVFDIMKTYNMYSDSPLTPSYDKCAEVVEKGEVGFWYMGNWASQNIMNSSSGNKDFGFIPVPISNNASDYGNNEISMGVTKYFIINKNSSIEQQEAAKQFLNYLVYNENGNKFLVEECGIIPAFNNINITQNDPLVNELIKFRDSGKTTELMNSYLPANNSQILGSALKKYLNNEISREDLIQQISDFWS